MTPALRFRIGPLSVLALWMASRAGADPIGTAAASFSIDLEDSGYSAGDPLFGNQGPPDNYHFLYEIHSAFTYQSGEFSFSGQDDFWVFSLFLDVEPDRLGLVPPNGPGWFIVESHAVASSYSFDPLTLLQQAPEPATLVLLGLGTVGFAAFRRRRD